MKQENAKKSKKWLWIIIALAALLVVAGVVLGIMFLMPTDAPVTDDQEETPTSEVYWNIDRIKYTQDSETGLSMREPAEDGLYHFRFATQGQLVDLAMADKQLVNYADNLDAMGLVFDADGVIIDVLDVTTISVETAKGFYIKKIDGNMVTVNSSIAMNGMDVTFQMPDNAWIMDVRQGTETLCQAIDLEVMDVINVYGSEECAAESVYVVSRSPSSQLYLRVDRMYDASTGLTTREPDENGVYTIPMSLNGELIDVKCKDKNVVSTIDSGLDAKQVMGLTFDEEGYVTGTILAATAIRGRQICSVYHITAIDGNNVEATRLMAGAEQGKVVNFTYDENTVILINEIGCGHAIGERLDDLVVGDRVVVWGDMDNKALYIKNDCRQVDVPMFYNHYRKYNSKLLETSRVPDENGYYVFELASKGKMVTLKTKNKDLASQIDADSWQYFGLKVKGNIIQEYYDANCVSGGYGNGGARFVMNIVSTIVQISNNGTLEQFSNMMLTSNTEIYDMTGASGTKMGSKTELRVGDRIISDRSPIGELTHVYVLDRYQPGCKLYYNQTRSYSSVTRETLRETDADGYYNYVMYCEGKEVNLKTKNKNIANVVDSISEKVLALKVSNGIIKGAYPATAHAMYSLRAINNYYVDKVDSEKNVLNYAFNAKNERVDATTLYKLASNAKIYNVSTDFKDHRGEKVSSLKTGDYIWALRDIKSGEITHVWITARAWNSPIYVNPTQRYNSTTQETTRLPNADGYYEVELFVDGQFKTFKTKDKALMSSIDAKSYELPFVMKTDGNIILAVASTGSSRRALRTIVGAFDVTKISGKNITTERLRPGQTNTGTVTEFKITNKTKIYDLSPYSDHRWESVKLKVGDRIHAYADENGDISYIFIWYPGLHKDGHISLCPHCNKKVFWEPLTGAFISTAGDCIHYYLPNDYVRTQQTHGADVNTNNTTERFTVVLDLNGNTLGSSGSNFKVYYDMIFIDTVGGGVIEANGAEAGNFQVIGGSVTIRDNITVRQANSPTSQAAQGGNFHVKNLTVKETGEVLVGTVNLENAKLEAWNCLNGGNIYMEDGTKLTIKNSTITGGDVKVGKDATVTLNGKVIIDDEGLDLTSGTKIEKSNLTKGSKVVVQANGVFTEKLSNLQDQKQYYVAERKFYPVDIKEDALWTDRDPVQPDFMPEPEIPELPEILSVDNTALVLDANSQATCPVCQKVVTWTAISDASASQVLENGKHYYLAEDIAFDKADLPYIQVTSKVSACLHLNDHNIIASKAMACTVSGELNIMGNGIVSGNGYDNELLIASPNLHAATIETNNSSAVLNLYGGTYVKSAENDNRLVAVTTGGVTKSVSGANHVVEIFGTGGGTINMFDGATIDARNTKVYGVMSLWGPFNMYGGTAYGGSTAAVGAGNWTSSKTGSVNIFGGTINAGTGTALNIAGIASAPGSVGVYGGTINGKVVYNTNSKFVLAGNPVINYLQLPSSKDGLYGGKIILGKLTDGAHIIATGVEEITYQNENVDTYVKYFESMTENEIVVINHAISFFYEKAPVLPEVPEVMPAYTEDLKFIGDTSWALCPVCKEYVRWTAITQDKYGSAPFNGGESSPDGSHFYLAEDIVYTGSKQFILGPGRNTTTNVPYVNCFHLNGHSLTSKNMQAIHGYPGQLNVMGSGTVTGNGKSGATVTANSSKQAVGGGVYLYSGTYAKAANNATAVIQSNNGGGTIWIGKDATVVTEPEDLAISVSGGQNLNGHMIIEGTVKGGNVVTNPSAGVNKIILELNSAILEGDVVVAKDTVVKVTGETKAENLDLSSGARITTSELSGEAMIIVKAEGLFTENLTNSLEQLPFYSASTGYYPVEDKNGALWTADDPNSVNELPEDPATPTLPSLLKVDNAALVLDGESKAMCPVCNKIVEWIAITDTVAAQNLEGGKHYYLTQDLTSAVTDEGYIRATSATAACLHLNGHNITATATCAIFVSGKLNVMGEGVVTGVGYEDPSLAAHRNASVEVHELDAVANLYGGTYTKPADSAKAAVGVFSKGGTLNIFEGVTVDTEGMPKYTMRSVFGLINVYGGTFKGGSSTDALIYLGNWSAAKSGSVNIFGGNFTSANTLINAGGHPNAHCKIGIYGGNLQGTVYIGNANVDTVIGGNPVIKNLNIKSGLLITLGELTDGADIKVTGSGTFTTLSANAEAYAPYFHASAEGKEITVADYVLSCTDVAAAVENAVMPALAAAKEPTVGELNAAAMSRAKNLLVK